MHHAFGEVKGRAGAWGIAKGGMGAITDAMARCAQAQGAALAADASVENIMIEGRRAVGVALADGRTFQARQVAADVHPQTLLTKMPDPGLLSAEDRRRIPVRLGP